MANTNAPAVNTHQTVLMRPTGSHERSIDGGTYFKYYNNYPIRQKIYGEDPHYVVHPRPEAELIDSINDISSDGPLVAAYYSGQYHNIFAVNGQDVIMISSTGTVTEDVARMNAVAYSAYFTEYRVDTTHYVVALTNDLSVNSSLRFYNPQTGAHVSSTSLASVGYHSAVFMDGYIFFAGQNTQRIYNTTLGTPTTANESTDFLDAETFSDTIVALAVHHNHVVAFGTRSIEFFYNAANEVGSPLQRQAAYSAQIGMYHLGFSNIEYQRPLCIGDDIYFLGGQNNTMLGLYRIRNFKIEKVSDDHFDRLLHNYQPAYIRLNPMYLYGEIVVMMSSFIAVPNIVSSFMYIPSSETFCEFRWAMNPGIALVVSSTDNYYNGTVFIDNRYIEFSPAVFYFSGDYNYYDAAFTSETFTSIWTSAYEDFGNNYTKFIKSVDVLGDFQANNVGLSIRRDDSGFDPTQTVPIAAYKNAGTNGPNNPMRFRAIGPARIVGFNVFVNGSEKYEFRGLAVQYNQGTY